MKPRQVFEFNEPVVGRHLQLLRLGPQHADYMHRSFADEQFWSAYRSNQNRALSRAELINRLEIESENSPQALGKIEWVIQAVGTASDDSGSPIGFAGLTAIDTAQGRAEFLLGIPKPAHRKPGVGLEASLLLFDYAFNRLRLHKLLSYVYADNETAQRNTRSLGFAQEGYLRAHFRREGDSSFKDVYLNGLLQSEFRQSRRLSNLSRRLLNKDITAPAGTVVESTGSVGLGEIRASFEISN